MIILLAHFVSQRLYFFVRDVDQSDSRSIASTSRVEPYFELNLKPGSGLAAKFAIIDVANRHRRAGDDRPPIDDYAIVNTSVSKANAFTKGWDFPLSVQSLFAADAREDVSVRVPFHLPVYPRSVLAGLTYRID